jgi:putative peptide zinc metalloprotease protein
LLFNGNPLLRFDGYYIFSDLIEIPNLASRGNAYLFYLIQKHLFKIDSVDNPVTEPSEAKWLAGYAICSFIYRLAVSLGIALFLAAKMVIIGIAMAIWAMTAIAIVPIFKGIKFLAVSPRLRGHRRHAIGVIGAITAAVAFLLFAIPVPYSTVAQGVIIVPDKAEVRAKTEGFITNVVAKSGALVAAGQPLITLDDPTLDARVSVLEAQLDETQQRLDGVRQIDRVQAEMFEDQVKHLSERLADFRRRQHDLTIVAEQAGRFVIADAQDRLGRFSKRGELLGYVISDSDLVVRTVVSQSDVDLIHPGTTRVEAHVVEDLDRPIAARILREVPAAQQDVPSLALTTRGGGSIALDPSKTQRPQALFSLFQLDVELLDPLRMITQGSRVYVRFIHGSEPVAWRILRGARQFFLGQFRV